MQNGVERDVRAAGSMRVATAPGRVAGDARDRPQSRDHAGGRAA